MYRNTIYEKKLKFKNLKVRNIGKIIWSSYRVKFRKKIGTK